MRASALVVDDEPASGRYMALALEEYFADVRHASGGEEALCALEADVPEVVVSDLRMPGMDGLELLDRIHSRWPEIPVILVTVDADIATAVDAVRRGAINYLVKPVSPAQLGAAAARALETARLPRVLEDAAVPEFLGESLAATRIRHLICLAARSDVNVMITGETGTGKELAARAIHRLSSLSKGPFVPHNCAVTPTELFESHFFGHVRGSFTGADRDRTGLLEEAHRGILFLDELECLPMFHQAKLLRVLDDGEVHRVGSIERRLVSVRVLSATNQEPTTLLENGSMRADLFYRLGALLFPIPPLRSRREDIDILTSHFLEGTGARVSPEALATLERSPWPGNVRQLRNLLAAARALCKDGVIRPGNLALDSTPVEIDSQKHHSLAGLDSQSQPGQMLKGAESQVILQALQDASGKLGVAARALGIHRSTLRRKIREYDITF